MSDWRRLNGTVDPYPAASGEEAERNPMGAYYPDARWEAQRILGFDPFCERCGRLECSCGSFARGCLACFVLSAILYATIWLVAWWGRL